MCGVLTLDNRVSHAPAHLLSMDLCIDVSARAAASVHGARACATVYATEEVALLYLPCKRRDKRDAAPTRACLTLAVLLCL
jgi:hypothetical protein